MPEPFLVEDDIYDLNITFYAKLTEDILPEDTWVKGWEFRVGDNKITHHMCSSMIAPGAFIPESAVEDEGADAAGSQLLSCVAEGGEPDMLPEGFGVLLETGSSISFNMHYHKEPAEGSAAWSKPAGRVLGRRRAGPAQGSSTTPSTTAGSRFRPTTRTTGWGRRGSSRRTPWC